MKHLAIVCVIWLAACADPAGVLTEPDYSCPQGTSLRRVDGQAYCEYPGGGRFKPVWDR